MAVSILLECDGYAGYTSFQNRPALEDTGDSAETAESTGETGTVTIANCWAHNRRGFYDAAIVIKLTLMKDTSDLSLEELADRPELIAIAMIADIYCEEAALKKLSNEERLAGRQEKVKPYVDAFFSYIESLDVSNHPEYSEKLRQAVNYALKYKEGLCQFLNDPQIPLDNMECERNIRKVAILRRNCLFSDSARGAAATALQMSLCVTARLNDADPEIYLQYCLEEGARHHGDTNKEYLKALVPWSEEYREYERRTLEKYWGPVDADMNTAPPDVKRRVVLEVDEGTA